MDKPVVKTLYDFGNDSYFSYNKLVKLPQNFSGTIRITSNLHEPHKFDYISYSFLNGKFESVEYKGDA